MASNRAVSENASEARAKPFMSIFDGTGARCTSESGTLKTISSVEMF